jgi:hypothetical protein
MMGIVNSTIIQNLGFFLRGFFLGKNITLILNFAIGYKI